MRQETYLPVIVSLNIFMLNAQRKIWESTCKSFSRKFSWGNDSSSRRSRRREAGHLCSCPRWVASACAHGDIREYKLCFRVILHHSKGIEASYSNLHQSLVREHLAGRQRSVQNAKAILLRCLKLVKAKAHKREPSKHIQTWEKRMLGELNEMCKIILICIPRCKFSQL